jgi:hypothetical protein
MDDLYTLIESDNLINDFQNKMVSHPNLSTLWIDYLSVREWNTNKLITQGKTTLKLMETVQDVNRDDVLLLILFLKTIVSD